MPLLDSLRIDFGAAPAVVPPDAAPNVTPSDPPMPPQEVEVAAKRGRGRPKKVESQEATPLWDRATAIEEVKAGLAAGITPITNPTFGVIMTECPTGFDGSTVNFTPPPQKAPTAGFGIPIITSRSESVITSATFTPPKGEGNFAEAFDLDAFVSKVVSEADGESFEVRLDAARIAVDLMRVRQGKS
jgi:hypothetical protein